MSGGYPRPVIRLAFDDLTADPAADPVWVIIRNPKLLPNAEMLSAYDGNTGFTEDGKIADKDAAAASSSRMIAKLVIAGRAYDATWQPPFDPHTGVIDEAAQAPLLPHPPWTPDVAAKLPNAITTMIMQEFGEAANPPKGSDAPTPTSSGPPSPSTTEPGQETPSQPS